MAGMECNVVQSGTDRCHQQITRGHDFRLVKGQSRLDVRRYYFPQRTVNEWNKLSADCVHSSSINTGMFKNRIDNHLVRAGYT